MLKVIPKYKKIMENPFLQNKGEIVILIIFIENVEQNLEQKVGFTDNENNYLPIHFPLYYLNLQLLEIQTFILLPHYGIAYLKWTYLYLKRAFGKRK